MQETPSEETSGNPPESQAAAPDDAWDDELIPDHEYDGIREYDNPVPDWLSLLFVGTIVWSVLYVIAAGLGLVDGFHTSYEKNLEALRQKRAEASAGEPEVDQSRLATAVEKEKRVKAGEKVYDTNCASCHAKNGGGQVGPNLTDDYWIHGGGLMKIYETVDEGVADAGMPAWGDRLSAKQMVAVVAYIRSIRGTDPAKAKPPEGDKFVPGK